VLSGALDSRVCYLCLLSAISLLMTADLTPLSPPHSKLNAMDLEGSASVFIVYSRASSHLMVQGRVPFALIETNCQLQWKITRRSIAASTLGFLIALCFVTSLAR